jgi:hypothetical protein
MGYKLIAKRDQLVVEGLERSMLEFAELPRNARIPSCRDERARIGDDSRREQPVIQLTAFVSVMLSDKLNHATGLTHITLRDG